ncbi:MAG: hypothetical protein AAF514_24150, partial [Verrucomicrobiota bacterium]
LTFWGSIGLKGKETKTLDFGAPGKEKVWIQFVAEKGSEFNEEFEKTRVLPVRMLSLTDKKDAAAATVGSGTFFRLKEGKLRFEIQNQGTEVAFFVKKIDGSKPWTPKLGRDAFGR